MNYPRLHGKSGSAASRLLPFVALFGLLGAEIVLRSIAWQPAAAPSQIAPGSQAKPVSEDGLGDERYGVHWLGAGDFVPNQNGIWRVVANRPFRLHSNSLGFRNHEERRPGAGTVVVVGASTTFGPFVPEEDTWPGWLGHALRRTHDAQVFNGARAGYTMSDKLNYIRDKVIGFKPDLVVMSIDTTGGVDQRGSYANVRAILDKQQSAAGATGWQALVEKQHAKIVAFRNSLETHSALFRTALDWHKSFVAAITSYRKPSWDGPAADSKYRSELAEAARLLKAADISLVLVYLPTPYELFPGTYPYFSTRAPRKPSAYAIARDLAAEMNIAFVDCAPEVSRLAAPETGFLLQKNPVTMKFEGDVHLSRFGNRIVGNAVAVGLAETGALASLAQHAWRGTAGSPTKSSSGSTSRLR